MKASEANFLDFLKNSPQFEIPIYQRTYSWTTRECKQLWEDILRTGREHKIPAHFTGSIVYIEKGLYQVTDWSPLLVIDGQQRLTTVMLLLEALARRMRNVESVNRFSAKKIREYYLLNSLEEGEQGFKLLLTETDRQSVLALMSQKPLPIERSHQILKNFEFFQKSIQALDNIGIVSLCNGLAKLTIVDIALDRTKDNPQLIFESMNSTGRDLSQADLIRNFILMALDSEHQTYLYENHWRPMERAFGQEAYVKNFDGFVRHYLTFKTGEIPKVNAVYDAFKRYARSSDVYALVEEVHIFANYYCAMALDQESDKELALAFRDLREMKVDVAFPFLLELYDDYENSRLSKEDFVQIVRLIESYVFRRAVCAIPTNSLNRTFARFGRAVKKESYMQSVEAHFLKLQSYRNFPNDNEFKKHLLSRDLYNFPRRSYWLRRLENYNRKEPVPVNEFTVEHIMPQNKNLSEKWRDALGPNWQKVQQEWLHTLGNLTLTEYNSEYSDRPFSEKRDMRGGFKESPLRLNSGLGLQDTWNVESILDRANRLAKRAVKVWAKPEESVETLADRRSKSHPVVGHFSDNHPYLATESPTRPVFDEFRKNVLALDPNIDEVNLKTYIAYKAETNFVDVVPQKRELKLILNLQFHELHDSRRWARDITNLGSPGNGDVEVRLGALEDLPYVMELVRQAFEKQISDGVLDA